MYPSGTSAIPRAAGLPLLGIIPQLARDPLGFLLRTAKEHGDVVQLDLGSRRMLLVTGADPLRYVLQENQQNFSKGYEKAKPLLGEGLVTSDGEEWRTARRLMQPAFRRQRLAALAPLMVAESHQLVEKWQPLAASGAPVDVFRAIMLLTQTIIVRTMLGADIGDRDRDVASSFEDTLAYLNAALLMPFPFLEKLPTPTNIRFKRALRLLDSVIFDIINERRQQRNFGEDLVSIMIQARDEETGAVMSDRQIRDQVMTIFLAGHETTASLLSWTFFEVSRNPHVETLLRDEIASVLGDRKIGFDDVEHLPYTRQVLDEALRMYPPAWMFARRSRAKDTIGGYDIPANQYLFISPYVTHHLPQYWQEPDRFDPSRFAPGKDENRPRYAYFPFGGGPRICIGNTFALMEAPLILATLMQHYRFSLVPGKKVKPLPLATLRPRPALWMTLEPLR